MRNLEKKLEKFMNENAHNVLIPTNAVIFTTDNGKKYPGVAVGGYFASKAFITSDKAFDSVAGISFGWYDFEDKKVYKDSKYNFSRPTVEEWQLMFTEEQRVCCWEWM